MDEFLKVFGDITISTVAVVIVALVFLWKLYTIVKNHLIEQASNYPKWHEQSVKIQKQFSETIAAIQTAQLNNLESLNRLAKMIAENEATTCRYRILRFNDEILHEQKHTKEHFDQILDDVTRYEKFCAEHPEYENNKAVLAIENIKRVYQNCSNENTFL